MAFDSVPWFVGGGAEHTAETARLFAYAATYAAQGITEPGDLKVTQLPTAGGSVRVATGSALIVSSYAGASQQTYIARAPSVTDVAITGTSAAGPRSDLIVVRIDDPNVYGGPLPANPKVGPYVGVDVIPNVSSTETAVPGSYPHPAIPLARVTLPASTSVVTAAMITDLRVMSNPRRSRLTLMNQPTPLPVPLTSSSMADWSAGWKPSVRVPEWATRVNLLTHLSGVAVLSNGDAVGQHRNRIGNKVGAGVDYDIASGSPSYRTSLLLATGDSVVAMQGTEQQVWVEGSRTNGGGYMQLMQGTTVVHDIEFLEEPI